MKKPIILGIALAALAMANVSRANFIAVGPPTGDWNQRWSESGVGSFTQIDLTYVNLSPGGPLLTPFIADPSSPQWRTGQHNNANAAAIFGPAVSSLDFTTYFFGDLYGNPVDGLTIDLQAFNARKQVDGNRLIYDGNNTLSKSALAGYSYVAYGWYVNNSYTPAEAELAVPDGGMSATLLGMSMVAIGWMRRQVRK